MPTLAPTLAALCIGLAIAGTTRADEGPGHSAAGTHEVPSHSGGSAHWAAPPEQQARANPLAASPESLARGAAMFRTHCAFCHGASGRGDGPGAADLEVKLPDLEIMAGLHSDGGLAWKIAHGRGPMPPWKGVLSETEIWNTVNFFKSLPEAAVAKLRPPAHEGHGSHDDEPHGDRTHAPWTHANQVRTSKFGADEVLEKLFTQKADGLAGSNEGPP